MDTENVSCPNNVSLPTIAIVVEPSVTAEYGALGTVVDDSVSFGVPF